MNFEDYITDDLLEEKPKKKTNSKKKGSRGERSICNVLNDRFKNILSKNPSLGGFSRSAFSGARPSQVNLSYNAKILYSGDIVCEKFRFTIESKNGYDDVFSFFSGNKKINDFLEQVEKDSQRCNKKPMLIWKKDRQPHLVFIKENIDLSNFNYYMHYKDWIIVELKQLLTKMPDDFFFEELN